MTKEAENRVSAPGRIILFGEHAFEFGEPAVAIAVDMRARCSAQVSGRFMVDEEELDQKKHAYVRSALLNGWTDMDTPVAVSTESDIPPELGLGGLAAGTVACLGSISMLHDHIIFEHIALNAFQAHCEVEKESIPLDTSISTHGGGIMLGVTQADNCLWTFRNQNRIWYAHDVELPEMELVLGYSGTPSPANEMKSKIARFRQRNSFARDIIRDMGKVTREGHSALVEGNLTEVGRLMNANHRLLTNLGVSNPALEKLVQAASRHSHGAKLTGYGGGGCIIALARDADKVAEAIENAGGKAIHLKIATDGLRLED
ncbi:MAG: mevalonate kinase [Candidatus Thermoplasmatota archaeon]|nr:mevalonate kinase [Euryarchaeota archaeon]MBU4032566.1 mevalonate kinase [Candidatus Thermoplasmatota archaeon]MBU4070548.1 mevalonate kinase [Candidatus Thermoplasmatota archaeon]MBU4144655.1 mevalonate kinase [Candidatus Thermoplasmatota archaeon]MBU4592730.1 mevalonate kinase [Candidatus Thermoplasmatota archaeon]